MIPTPVVVQRPQRVEHRVEPSEVAGLDPGAPGLAQVAEVGFQLGEGRGSVGPREPCATFVRHVGVVLGVGPTHHVAQLRLLVQPLGRVVADRPEHREPPVTVLVEAPDEALVDEGDEAIEHRGAVEAVEPGGDRLHRVDACGVEDREEPEDRPLVVVEQPLAPLDRASQRLLARREIAGARTQYADVLAEPVPELVRREQREARGRELDRERQAVEPAADLGDGRGVVLGQLEPWTHVARSLDEQPPGLRTGHGRTGGDTEAAGARAAAPGRGARLGPAGPPSSSRRS